MSVVHTVTAETDGDGAVWLVSAGCSGSDADKCRQWCAEGCEEACWREADVGEHRWAPIGYCRITEWLEAVGLDDTHAEDEPLRPGTHVIKTEWTGDDYIWSYAQVAEVAS